MVTNGVAGTTTFFRPDDDNNPTDTEQNLEGEYQLEVRRGTEYGRNVDSRTPSIVLFSPTNRLHGDPPRAVRHERSVV